MNFLWKKKFYSSKRYLWQNRREENITVVAGRLAASHRNIIRKENLYLCNLLFSSRIRQFGANILINFSKKSKTFLWTRGMQFCQPCRNFFAQIQKNFCSKSKKVQSVFQKIVFHKCSTGQVKWSFNKNAKTYPVSQNHIFLFQLDIFWTFFFATETWKLNKLWPLLPQLSSYSFLSACMALKLLKFAVAEQKDCSITQ